MEKDGRAFVPVMFGDREYVNSETGEAYSGIYRRGVAVEYVSMAVADYDDGFTIEDASELWKDHEFVIYSSHSNSPSHHKFRVVLPLAEPVKAEGWPSAWLHFSDMASVDGHRIDRKCKDLPHPYYLPSHRPGATSVYIHNRGSLLLLPITEHPSEASMRASAAQSWKKRHPLRRQRGGVSVEDGWSKRASGSISAATPTTAPCTAYMNARGVVPIPARRTASDTQPSSSAMTSGVSRAATITALIEVGQIFDSMFLRRSSARMIFG